MITVIGLFDRPDFKTFNLMRSLESHLGPIRFIVVWDDPTPHSEFTAAPFEHLTILEKATLIAACAKRFSIVPRRVQELADAYKPFYKILLAIYCRTALGVGYCVMTDNDIYIFEPIDEIQRLVAARQPFLIQEASDACRIPDISTLLQRYLGRNDSGPVPTKGQGYNVGFCGMDLTMFDAVGHDAFDALLELFKSLDVWHKEQALFVSMIFGFSKDVHVFDRERYVFLAYDDPCYRLRSKIFHCIYTTDKTMVDYYYRSRGGTGYFVLRELLRCVLRSARRLMRRVFRPAAYLVSTGTAPPPARYRHLLDHLRCTPCSRILEIGVWRGDTAARMLRCSKNGNVEYHGIDVFELGTPELVAKEVSLAADSMDAVLARLRRISQSVFLHQGYSTEMLPKLRAANLEFDCIWIDGGHSYATVKSDFEYSVQLLRNGGTIFVDDYTKDSHLPDVRRFVDQELVPNKRYAVTVHDQWVDYYRGYAYKVVSVRVHPEECAASPLADRFGIL